MSNLSTEKDNTPIRRVEAFQKMINKKLQEEEISRNNQTNTDYLAISHVQMKLDELYFGLWQTHSYQTNVIANELVGQIVLEVFHPKARMWIRRTGTSAVQIRMEKGSKITQIDKKLKNALIADAPHLMAECIKSAAKTLGVQFGRDLNRSIVDTYEPIIETHEKKAEQAEKKKKNNLMIFITETADTIETLETVKARVEDEKTPEDIREAYQKRHKELSASDDLSEEISNDETIQEALKS